MEALVEVEVDHLQESAFLELIEGRGSPDARAHLEACPRCRGELVEWQALNDDLRAAADLAMEPGELHRLGVLFRAFGPIREGCREWIARLLSPSVHAVVAVRGGGAAPVEHEAGPFHVAMQVRSGLPRDEITVHGQVYSEHDDTVIGEVILSDAQGVLRLAEIDDLGEFSVSLPAGGSYRATLLLPTSRIVIEPLEIPSRH